MNSKWKVRQGDVYFFKTDRDDKNSLRMCVAVEANSEQTDNDDVVVLELLAGNNQVDAHPNVNVKVFCPGDAMPTFLTCGRIMTLSKKENLDEYYTRMDRFDFEKVLKYLVKFFGILDGRI